ncbi:protein Mis18-beta isoform X2 [Cheilinus undulatus]|uniref:protein Mis18-beta isoform X2 n=1 Tax=Cheilinus undulatus TaxID=241271 RepID=UPI001BD49561|nr:protein Mis18-beta isoform X2 [Cheilinus undulatus]
MEFDGSVLVKCNDEELHLKLDHKQRMTLHCQQCNTVLGDSYGICGEVKSMDSILCLKVTDDVVMSDVKELGQKGELANCIYSSLKCRCCRFFVGKVIHASPSRWATIRSLFLLYKTNIRCYILNSSSMVKASSLTTFDVNAFRARQQFESQLDQTSHVKSRLSDRSVSSQLDK